MKQVVIDCSVIVKWFFQDDEPRVKQALELRNLATTKKIQLIALEFFWLEILNVVMLSKKIPSDELKKLVNFFIKLKIDIQPMKSSLINQIIFLVQKYKITTYDASYVALAKINKCQLITDDVKLKNKTKLKFIKLLKDY